MAKKTIYKEEDVVIVPMSKRVKDKAGGTNKEKNDYCLNNNIPLIRIPFTHLDNLCIDDLKLETSKFIK